MAEPKRSAALALVRGDEVLIAHPGGPYWANKDEGAWTLPKGLIEPGEDALAAARREFGEETGTPAPDGEYVALGEVRLKSGKYVVGFAVRGELDVSTLRSAMVTVEWPPRSGQSLAVPELDRAMWATLERARVLLNPAQVPLVERALAALAPAR
jgi:predicted NUDIX family NTP pyrophosphohydrolase